MQGIHVSPPTPKVCVSTLRGEGEGSRGRDGREERKGRGGREGEKGISVLIKFHVSR